MALNGNLNAVLNNIVNNVSPVIKHSNGLYTLIDKTSVIPDNLSNNLKCRYYIAFNVNDIKLLGSQNKYFYDSTTNTWALIQPK